MYLLVILKASLEDGWQIYEKISGLQEPSKLRYNYKAQLIIDRVFPTIQFSFSGDGVGRGSRMF